MPDVRRCAIYGCKSNSRDYKDLKFFNFPERENRNYEIWLGICHESSDSIRWQRRPYICSKHFHEKDVGFRRLAAGAVPALNLSAPPGFAEEENARLAEIAAEQAEKLRRVKLINDSVLEWCKRAIHYSDTAAVCTTRRELRKIATNIRNLLGATLTVNVDDYWLRKFRRSHMVQMETMDLDESRNKTLDLPTIINELDPTAVLLSAEEIEVLVKEEREKLAQMELNRSIARANKPCESEGSSASGSKYNGKKYTTKKNKRKYDDDLSDSYEQSRDNSRDSQLEVRPDRNDSIDLTHDGFDDDDILEYGGPDVKSEPIIDSYKQALEHLKPLEDFALRQENYRAIGLLSTLEIIFKSPNPAQRN